MSVTPVDQLVKKYIVPAAAPVRSTPTTTPTTGADAVSQAALAEAQVRESLRNPGIKPIAPATPKHGPGILGRATGALGTAVGEGLHAANFALGATQKYASMPIQGLIAKGTSADNSLSAAIRSYANIHELGPSVDLGIATIHAGDLLPGVGLGSSFADLISPDSEQQAQNIRAAQSFTAAARENQKSLSELEKIGLDIIADPSTWITMGTASAVERLPIVAEMLAQSPEVFRAWSGFKTLIGTVQDAQALPLTLPMKGVKRAATAVFGNKAFDETIASLFSKEGKKVIQGGANAAAQGISTTPVAEVPNIFGENIKRGISITDLAGSKQVANNINTIETLNTYSTPERLAELDNMGNADRQSMLTMVTPSDPAATDIVHWAKQKGLLQDTVTPAVHTTTGPLAGMTTDLNALSVNTKGKLAFLDKHIYNNNTPTVTNFIDKNLSRADRHAAFTYYQANPALDPNNIVRDHLISRGEAALTPSTTGLQRTAKLAQGTKLAPINDLPAMAAGAQSSDKAQQLANDIAAAHTNIDNYVLHAHNILFARGDVSQMDQTITDILKEVATRNPKQFSMQTFLMNKNIAEPFYNAMMADTEKEARTYLGLAFSRMNMQHSAFGIMFPSVVRNIDRIIPKTRATADAAGVIVTEGVSGAVLGERDMQGLAMLFEQPKVQELQATYEKMHAAVSDVMNKHALTQMTDTTTAGDIWDALDKGLITDPKDVKTVQAFLKKFDMTPEAAAKLTTSKTVAKLTGATAQNVGKYTVGEAYLDKMVETWSKARAADLGIANKIDNKMLAGLAWVPKLWREQALLSPRYHLANWMDMITRGLIYGVNPLRQTASAEYYTGKLGTALPQDLMLGQGKYQNLAQLTNLPEIIGSSKPPQWASVPVVGKVMGPLVTMNRALARASENTVRKWAWMNGSKDYLTTYLPELEGNIRRMTTPQVADAVMTDLRKTGNAWNRSVGIEFSPDDLYMHILNSGGDTGTANAASNLWATAVDNSTHVGVDFANKVQLDFETAYNIEDKLFLSKWLPFHFFATRNIPFYLETLAAHPEIVNAWQAYQDVSEQDRIDIGLPSRYKGFMPIGDGFLAGLFGPGQIYFNPLATISLFDQTKSFGQDTGVPGQPTPDLLSRAGVGNALSKLGGVGMGVAPWVQIPMSMLGFYGAQDEPMPIFRFSGLTEDATGHDLFGENLVRKFENSVRAISTGQKVHTFTGSQMRDNQIVTRLQDNMLDDIQRNPYVDPDVLRHMYIQASKDGPSNPLWQTAATQVRQTNLHRDLATFVNPLPSKSIRQTQLNEQTSSTNMYAGLPAAALADKTVQRQLRLGGVLAAQAKGFQRPQTIDVATGQPVYNGVVEPAAATTGTNSNDLFTWGGSVWGPTQPSPYNNRNLMSKYGEWVQVQPVGHKSPEEFFAQYNIPY